MIALLIDSERVMRDALKLVQHSEALMARSQTLARETVALGQELVTTVRTFVEVSTR